MAPTKKRADTSTTGTTSDGENQAAKTSAATGISEDTVANNPDPQKDDLTGGTGGVTLSDGGVYGVEREFVVTGRPRAAEVEEPKKQPTKVEDQEFVYPTHTDPMRLVPGTSPYLDDEQRRTAEVERARIEDREPDLKNPPAMQSTPLVERNALARTNTIPDDVQAVTLGVAVLDVEQVKKDREKASSNK